ncbi:unnamed protein product [Echinostoma caproni]|uniref:Cadherin domain-containing protein n=1 Tax=Echinostoma caproni TaxID=27848 RepID=A0A183ADG5_9TREM|nr:unnamed protein product [Echinostoma caproni]
MIAFISYFVLVYGDLLSYTFSTSTATEQEYRIKEELPLGTQVGNLVDDVLVRLMDFGLVKSPNGANPKPDQLKRMFMFKILNYADRGVNCFEIKPDGRLVTIRRIDREQLCSNRQLKSPNSPYGMLERATDPLLLQSAGSTNKMHDTDNRFCPITIQCALYPLEQVSATTQSTQSSLNALSSLKSHFTEQNVIQIRVLVEDINDSPPYWPGHLQRFQVQFRDGDPIGERRTLPPALDNDVGNSVECRLRTVNFTLARTTDTMDSGGSNPVSGMVMHNLLTAVELDREGTAIQNIPILCSDMVGHYTEQNVTVHITDVNDNKPQFVQNEFAFQVEENAPPGTPLRRISATQASVTGSHSGSTGTLAGTEQPFSSLRASPVGLYQWNLLATDLDSGPNAEIHYRLLENGLNSTGFVVDPISGALTTAAVFDRERMDHYVLQALAIDKGNPPLTGTIAVKVSM